MASCIRKAEQEAKDDVVLQQAAAMEDMIDAAIKNAMNRHLHPMIQSGVGSQIADLVQAGVIKLTDIDIVPHQGGAVSVLSPRGAISVSSPRGAVSALSPRRVISPRGAVLSPRGVQSVSDYVEEKSETIVSSPSYVVSD